MATLLYRINEIIVDSSTGESTLYVDYPSSIVSQYDDVTIQLQYALANKTKALARIEVTIEDANGVEYSGVTTPDAVFTHNQNVKLSTIVPDMSSFTISNSFITFNFVYADGTNISTGKLNFRLFVADSDISYSITDMQNVYTALNQFGLLFKNMFDTIEANTSTVEASNDKVNEISTKLTEIIISFGKRLDDLENK